MGWLKPLDGGTWWTEPAGSPEAAAKRKGPKVRTVGGVQCSLEDRVAKARELAKTYKRIKVAKLMKVDPSTVSKWLGPKYLEKRPYSKRDL